MDNVLLVGNGFDLAHGLLTKYDNFLFLMKNWGKFLIEKEKLKNVLYDKNMFDGKNEYSRYLINRNSFNEDNIRQLGNIIKNNLWVDYYRKCEAEIDGWIDFEREVYPVLNLFENIFKARYRIVSFTAIDGKTALFERDDLKQEDKRIADLIKGIIIKYNQDYYIAADYVSSKYGILKKKIIKKLREEFDEFIRAFEIYLHEFVYTNNHVRKLKQLDRIKIDSVISFNYTLTEKLYGIDGENVHHIHGMIREDLLVGANNMVVGVNEQKNQNMDFVYFVKYFQRIQKNSGVKYKQFIDMDFLGRPDHKDYTLHIYGHSLDETDEDILRYVIGKLNSKNQLHFKPRKVVIYYYDQSDFEQKVINLIKLYNRGNVEQNMENGMFEFVEIDGEYLIDKDFEF